MNAEAVVYWILLIGIIGAIVAVFLSGCQRDCDTVSIGRVTDYEYSEHGNLVVFTDSHLVYVSGTGPVKLGSEAFLILPSDPYDPSDIYLSIPAYDQIWAVLDVHERKPLVKEVE